MPKKSSRSKKLRRTAFSKRRLIAFIIIFGLIGGYALWRAFAATPPPPGVSGLEAEDMSLSAGASIINDSSAHGGQAVRLTQNSPSSGSLNGTVSIIGPSSTGYIRARGTKNCDLWPNIGVKIDGNVVLPYTAVKSTSWTKYYLNISSMDGAHTITVYFTNSGHLSGCQKYLYVDDTIFNDLYGFDLTQKNTI